jgi:hypothetical protein
MTCSIIYFCLHTWQDCKNTKRDQVLKKEKPDENIRLGVYGWVSKNGELAFPSQC